MKNELTAGCFSAVLMNGSRRRYKVTYLKMVVGYFKNEGLIFTSFVAGRIFTSSELIELHYLCFQCRKQFNNVQP